MATNDDIEGRRDVPALFAEITALLEDAHEIAVRGQNAKLERAALLQTADELERMLGQIRLVARTVRGLL